MAEPVLKFPPEQKITPSSPPISATSGNTTSNSMRR